MQASRSNPPDLPLTQRLLGAIHAAIGRRLTHPPVPLARHRHILARLVEITSRPAESAPVNLHGSRGLSQEARDALRHAYEAELRRLDSSIATLYPRTQLSAFEAEQ